MRQTLGRSARTLFVPRLHEHVVEKFCTDDASIFDANGKLHIKTNKIKREIYIPSYHTRV